jgi:hypothetical protein
MPRGAHARLLLPVVGAAALLAPTATHATASAEDLGSEVVIVATRDGRAPARPGVDPAAALCEPRQPSVSCGPGGGRKTSGGGDKVPHKGWPSVTGILWKVLDSTGRKKVSGPTTTSSSATTAPIA